MIPYKAFNAIDLGFTTIYVWGIFVALGILIGILIASKNAKKYGIEKNIIYDLAFYIILSGIIGARIGFYVVNPSLFNVLDFFKIWQGGLAFYGGFIAAFLTGIFYTKKKRFNFWKVADLFALPLIIGHIIGRIGCYISGEHIGKVSNVAWAIFQENALRHPVILYEIIGLIAIAIVISKIRDKKDGIIFLSYALLYSVLRFIVTFFRAGDNLFLFLTGSQYVSIVLFVAIVVLLKRMNKP